MVYPAVVSIQSSTCSSTSSTGVVAQKSPNAPHCVDDDYSSTSILSDLEIDLYDYEEEGNEDGAVRMRNSIKSYYNHSRNHAATAPSGNGSSGGGGGGDSSCGGDDKTLKTSHYNHDKNPSADTLQPRRLDNASRNEGKGEKLIRTLLQVDLCSRDKKHLAESLRKLSDLISNDDRDSSLNQYRRVVDKFQGVPVVLFVMRQNAKHVKIQSQGCRFLMKYMYHNPTGKDTIGRLGGIAVIVKAMQTFKNNSSLQRNALGALVNGIWKHEGNERELVEPSGPSPLSLTTKKKDNQSNGGISIIVTAMKTHPRDAQLQLRACKLLSFICHVERYRCLVLQEGGYKRVGIAIKKHGAKDSEVLKYGKRVAQSLVL